MEAEGSASNVLEQDTSRSLAATLALARTKGYIGTDDRKKSFRPGGSGGPSSKSKARDPEDYKPEIKLEYTDDTGRKLETPKDAFRYMCYKFHGKGPGKNKIDKRLRKLELERKMKQSLTTDLPSSAALMISKQEELQSPFIVLSRGK